MKKTYTKKQIQEAIAYWEKQLNESEDNAYDIEVRVLKGYENPSDSYTQAEIDEYVKKGQMKLTSRGNVIIDANDKDSVASDYFFNMSVYLPDDVDDMTAKEVTREIESQIQKHFSMTGIYVDEYTWDFNGDRPDAFKAKTFEVTTLWYNPVTRSEAVKADSKEEAEKIIVDKYSGYTGTSSESSKTFSGVLSIKEKTTKGN